MKTIVITLSGLFLSLGLMGCGEQKVTLNIVQTDANGQCWSEWYTIPVSEAGNSDDLTAYISAEEIKPFEVTPTSC